MTYTLNKPMIVHCALFNSMIVTHIFENWDIYYRYTRYRLQLFHKIRQRYRGRNLFKKVD